MEDQNRKNMVAWISALSGICKSRGYSKADWDAGILEGYVAYVLGATPQAAADVLFPIKNEE